MKPVRVPLRHVSRVSCVPTTRALVSGEPPSIPQVRPTKLVPAVSELLLRAVIVKCPASTSEVNEQPSLCESETLEFATKLSVEPPQCAGPDALITGCGARTSIARRTPRTHAIFALAPA